MKRILTIDKCADCNIENCKLRTMRGLIPDECPLQKESEVNGKPSWDDAPDWANWLTYDESGWFWWKEKPSLYDKVYLMRSDGIEMNSADYPVPGKVTRAICGRPESPKEVSE